MNIQYLKIALCLVVTPVFQMTAQTKGINDLDLVVEHKIDSIIELMTVKEKVGQMVQYNGSFDVTGIPSDIDSKTKLEKLKNGEVGSMLNVLTAKATREAQQVVMENSRLKIPLLFGYDVIHGYKTMFPVPLGESASWDLEAIQLSASIAAKETAAAGVHWTFAPMIDVSRDARWGRIMEGAGEDPYLNSVIGVARINGFQGGNLDDIATIAACAKHFAGYGFAEAGRDYNTVNVGESELQNAILMPFKAASEAGVATFMNSFNEIDGVPATASSHLQRDILKGEWDYKGFMVSDWGSIAELIPHGFAKDKMQAGELAVVAGSDMDMEGRVYEEALEPLVSQSKIDETLLDAAVRRILRVKFHLGLFEDPYKYSDAKREKEVLLAPEHLVAARDIARKSIVLLKNENEVLPLKKDVKSIAVIGPLADDKDSPLGNWRAQANKNSAVSVLEGIKKAVGSATTINYAKGADLGMGERSFLMPLKINEADKSGLTEAVEAAENSEVVVMVLGEDAFQTGEGRSQTGIKLRGVQQDLLDAVSEINSNIVLILMNGRPLDLSKPNEQVSAILETWFLGSEAGNAIADVLFGAYNPSGKLPVSFPRNVGQEPLYYNQKNTGRPFSDMVTYSGYQDGSREGLFPFGYGLSYTTFEYGKLQLSAEEFSGDATIELSVEVTNTGKVAGKETIQLYIHDLFASRTRPVKELRDFRQITLEPGASKTVNFTISPKTLEFYTANKMWEAEAGEFEVMVGSNSVDLQKVTFQYKN
ncbi:beta-glucosidase BglX [Leeuwenhoekiella marinoflava]|uniref:beta-glucosidase n=2 Tax=Leeuwenhoekiella marinoflava TaxID=988 RepID=A0A4Q0PK00_9FLAO|nr:beta-glucosidase BglX [Leeuwenhoekiella marinoflava]RXG28264.1 beta-glucosidase [Leeuwenhoekiella marinoflava]SHF57993.1 beta-glucosidase [Leeuwenhoekiella marinoflava DSM 3653]